MDEIKVGEYVRTKDGVIFKILTKDKSDFGNHYYGITDNENYSNYTYGKGSHNDIKNKILKHSFNIINLIEINDIVNESLVVDLYKILKDINKPEEGMTEIIYLENGQVINKNNEIKTILTREQYERDCYIVKEKLGGINGHTKDI